MIRRSLVRLGASGGHGHDKSHAHDKNHGHDKSHAHDKNHGHDKSHGHDHHDHHDHSHDHHDHHDHGHDHHDDHGHDHGDHVHRVWKTQSKPVYIPSQRPSEMHMFQEIHDGEFDKYRKEMMHRRDNGNPQNELCPRTFAFQPDDLNFRAAEKIQHTKPLVPRGGKITKDNEKAFPYPFAFFVPFFFLFYYTFLHANSGSRAQYLIPDPDKTHPYIRFNKLPALKHGYEPLCNPDNHGGLCEIRPLPDTSHLVLEPRAVGAGH